MLSKIELIEYGAKVLTVFDEKVTMQEIVWILENMIEAINEVNQTESSNKHMESTKGSPGEIER